jgi:hypothetical protein
MWLRSALVKLYLVGDIAAITKNHPGWIVPDSPNRKYDTFPNG